jgi:hypothetical protein
MHTYDHMVTSTAWQCHAVQHFGCLLMLVHVISIMMRVTEPLRPSHEINYVDDLRAQKKV